MILQTDPDEIRALVQSAKPGEVKMLPERLQLAIDQHLVDCCRESVLRIRERQILPQGNLVVA